MNTRRNIVAGLILSTALVMPLAASALSIEELQTQIRELLQKVAQLQTQLRIETTDNGVSGETSATISAVPRICMLDFAGSLGVGNRGEGVRGIQEFLRSEGVLSAEATGYFGVQTEAALKKWQATQGIVSSGDARTTGWGRFGPATRARINAKCGMNNVITATPSQGSAPLTVVVASLVGDSGSIRPSAYDGQDTLIDFGDGSERQWVNCEGKTDDRYGTLCEKPMSYKHTYSSDGTYTITLVKAGGMCMGGCPERIIGTAYVTVGSAPTSGTFSASPNSGAAPLSVSFTYQPTEENGQYYIEYGDGSGERMTTHQIYCIKAPCISPAAAKHVYRKAGTYTASVNRYIACFYSNPRCMMAQPAPLAMAEITVTGASNDGAPSISRFSGPVALAVNEVGTWGISASDPENGKLTYSIVWGDEWYRSNAAYDLARPEGTIVQQSTFTHSYVRAGTYTVQVSVSDEAGNTARSSSTVTVTQNACTGEYAPVCGRPSGCANTCAPGMVCPAICQLYQPQTYSNRCQLNNSNADFIHEGACTGSETY